MSILIADSGATKCEWCIINNGKKQKIKTIGISPYFLKPDEIVLLINNRRHVFFVIIAFLDLIRMENEIIL